MKPNLALRYIKASKSRTTLTIIGIALALALMMCIGNFFSTLTHTLVQSAKEDYGDYYVRLTLDDSEKLTSLSSDERVEKSGVLRSISFAQVSEGKSESDPFPRAITVLGYDDSMAQISPIELDSGRMPERRGDIVLSSFAAEQLGGLTVGDTLHLTTGQYDVTFHPTEGTEEQNEPVTKRVQLLSYENIYNLQNTLGYPSVSESIDFEYVDRQTKEYTVVGVMKSDEPSSAYDFSNNNGTALVYPEDENAVAAAYYLTAPGVSLDNFVADCGGSPESNPGLSINYMLLSYEQTDYNDYSSIFPLFSVITALFVFVSVIVGLAAVSIVRNTFSLTVTERLRDYGLLRCAGATPSQILKMLVQEVGIMLIIAVPLGLLLGFMASLGLIAIVNSMDFAGLPTIYLAVSPLYCAISVGIGLIATFIAVVNPFRSVTRIAPVEVTRGTRQIKLPRRAVRQNKLAKLVFGFEGDLSLRNMKRNGKRSRTVIVSLTICVALFICTSALLTVLSSDLQRSGAKNSVDIAVTAQDTEAYANNKQAILSLSGISRSAQDKCISASIGFEKGQIDPTLFEATGNVFQAPSGSEDLPVAYASFHIIDRESYDSLIGQNISPSMSYDEWIQSKGAIVYNYYQVTSYAQDGPQIINGSVLPALKAGESFSFYTEKSENTQSIEDENLAASASPQTDADSGQEPPYSKNDLDVSALLEKLPWYIMPDGYSAELFIFLPEENAASLLPQSLSAYTDSLAPNLYIDAGGKNVKELKQSIEKLDDSLYVSDMNQYVRESNNAYILFVLCIYGFVGVISLISCLNIINIISTNLILRRQEFGLLQAVGMSVSQVRRLVFYESFLYSLKSVFYGVLIGAGLTLLFFYLVSGTYATTFAFNWLTILYAAVSAFLVSLLASWPTLRRLRRMSIVDTIRCID